MGDISDRHLVQESVGSQTGYSTIEFDTLDSFNLSIWGPWQPPHLVLAQYNWNWHIPQMKNRALADATSQKRMWTATSDLVQYGYGNATTCRPVFCKVRDG